MSAGSGLGDLQSVRSGGPILDLLREWGFAASPFNGGRRALDPNRFMNRRAESYWELRLMLEAGQIALPPDAKLTDELLATQWRVTPEGKVRIEEKGELRGRLGRSPDRLDAVVMAAYRHAVRRVGIGGFSV